MYTPLIVDFMEDFYYNLSEETKLLIPAVTARLQTGNIRIWPTGT